MLVVVVAWGVPLSDEAAQRHHGVARRGAGLRRPRRRAISIAPAASMAGDPEFVNITAWQGGGRVLDPLERTGPGEYRMTELILVHGGWKANLRVHRGDAPVSVPIYLPEDRAIPAPAVGTPARFTRPFQPDIELLQRERKPDVPGALSAAAYLTVLAIVMSLFAFFAWALLRRPAATTAPGAGPGASGREPLSVS